MGRHSRQREPRKRIRHQKGFSAVRDPAILEARRIESHRILTEAVQGRLGRNHSWRFLEREIPLGSLPSRLEGRFPHLETLSATSSTVTLDIVGLTNGGEEEELVGVEVKTNGWNTRAAPPRDRLCQAVDMQLGPFVRGYRDVVPVRSYLAYPGVLAEFTHLEKMVMRDRRRVQKRELMREYAQRLDHRFSWEFLLEDVSFPDALSILQSYDVSFTPRRFYGTKKGNVKLEGHVDFLGLRIVHGVLIVEAYTVSGSYGSKDAFKANLHKQLDTHLLLQAAVGGDFEIISHLGSPWADVELVDLGRRYGGSLRLKGSTLQLVNFWNDRFTPSDILRVGAESRKLYKGN